MPESVRSVTHVKGASRSSHLGVARPGALYLRCSRCGLSVGLKVSWLTIEHCPRCLARARRLVEMQPADPHATIAEHPRPR